MLRKIFNFLIKDNGSKKAICTFSKIVFLFSFLFSNLSYGGLLKDFDSLGGNDVLFERAKKLQPNKKIGVVQNRIVDRTWRHEVALGYGNFVGGDTFLNSQSVDVNYQLHINPYVSVGGSYSSFFNQFSREGRFLIDNKEGIPDIDYLKDAYELTIQAYPFYGKLNLLNLAVLHFDLYAVGSYGIMNTDRGDSDMFSVGGGVGIWFSKYISSRFEVRERFFTVNRKQGGADLDMTVISFSLGFLI